MSASSVVKLPLLPLRDVVVYPHMVLPLFVGREKSIEALEDAMATDKQVLLVAQRNAAVQILLFFMIFAHQIIMN